MKAAIPLSRADVASSTNACSPCLQQDPNPSHVSLSCTYNEHNLALITGQSKAQLSSTSFTFLPERLEESIFCQADTDATTESAFHVELVLPVAVFLLLCVLCELGKESRLYASWAIGFKHLHVLNVDILFCIAW